MTAAVVLDGPSLTGEECLMLVREVAPLVIGRPLALQEVERQTLADLDGRGACWSVVLRDGDVELRAGVFNGEGNPRDGYGYGLSAKLLIPGVDGASGWRAELYGGGWEPVLAGPIRLYVIGLSPETFEAVRARVRALLPRHRDITFDDAYTVRSLVSDFDRHGHVAWVKDFLAQPLRQGLPWLTAELCERKIALHGPDPETARAWLGFEPYASLAWTALADAGGDASTREGEARLLAALTNPFSPGLVEAASKAYPIEAEALAGAMAHVYRDAAWRWLDASERDAFEARAHAWEPSTSTEVRWARPGHVASNAVEREIAALLLEGAAALENHFVVTGPPLAERGSLSHRVGLGTGHCARRAIVALDPNAPRSRVVATCQINAEDRLACFGLAWLDAARQLVWRFVVHEEGERMVRSPVALQVIDRGTDGWGAELEARLAVVAGT